MTIPISRIPLGHPRGLKRVFLRVAPLLEGPWLALPASLRGFWTQLQVYCSAQENGGRIRGGKDWRPEMWRMILGAGGNLRAVRRLLDEGLVSYEGNDVMVTDYDTDAEDVYRRKREGGRVGGIASAQRRAEHGAETTSALSSSPSTPSSTAARNPSRTAVEVGRAEASTGKCGGEEPRDAEEGWAEVGVARVEGGPPGLDPSDVPQNDTEALDIFASMFLKRFGLPYIASEADSMFIRANWHELEPDELIERFQTFLASRSKSAATLAAFIGWYRAGGVS